MKKIFLQLFTLFIGSTVYSQQIVYPSDTLVDPSFFNTSELLVDWELGLCPVEVATMGPNAGDTTWAPCYTVTYRDHYETSIDLCPDNLDEVGGVGLFNGDPRLLDQSLFDDMELDGSNIISNQDNYSINFKNLTSGEETGGGGMNVKYCIEADLFEGTNNAWYQQFQILLGPIERTGPSASTPYTYHTAETIGVLKNGMILEHTPPSSESTAALQGGIIPVDRCGWHPEPAGFGHFHAIPYGINIPLTAGGISNDYHCTDFGIGNGSTLAGFTFEGIPMYGPYDQGETSAPTDLDECNGHIGVTPQFPEGVYHYHASATEIINNPPCRDYYAPLEETRFIYGEWVDVVNITETLKEEGFQLTIYPNPIHTLLKINGEYDALTIFNESGQTMSAFSQSKGIEVDVQEWETGTYFIQAQKGEKVFFDKVFIK